MTDTLLADPSAAATAAQLAAVQHALIESNARFETLADAMPQMVWSTLPDGYHDYYNAQWYSFTGVPAGSTDGEAWNGMFHPDDQERAWAAWRHSLAMGEPYEIEYRLRHHSGEYRWVLGRALPIRNDAGAITRWIGTCTDIADAKRSMQQAEVLSHELSHRIKNIFAIISGLIGLSARQDPAMRDFARSLQGRIAALGRAHDVVRPTAIPHVDRNASTVQQLIRGLLAPYPASDEGRVTVTGDDVRIDDRVTTPIALVIHELATNAVKYGALSMATGRVTIHTQRSDARFAIDWREQGGPAVLGAPVEHGFGTRLTELSIEQQLGGTLERHWLREGFRMKIDVALDRICRRDAS